MADIKFSEFTKATISKDSDEIAILQDGVNKMIASPILESKIINKTVSRVIEQGGASLNLINPIGVVPTYADLATITPTPELNDAYQVEADGLVYVYTENGFQADGDGFLVQAEPNGVVEEGNTKSVSGGEVYDKVINKSDIGFDASYVDYSNYIQTDTVIDIFGNPVNESGSVSVVGMPVDTSGLNIILNNIEITSGKRFVFRTSNGTNTGSGGVQSLNVIPFSRPIPLNASVVSFTFRNSSDLDQSIMPLIEYSASDKYVKSLENVEIIASALSEDNKVPHAINPENAVNKYYIESNVVLNKNLGISEFSTTNKLDRNYIELGRYIDSDGVIGESTNEGLRIIQNHPATDFANKTMTFNGYFPESLKKLVFRDNNGSVIGNVVSLSTAPFTIIFPQNVFTFDMAIKRLTDSESSYDELRLNIGANSLPYEPFNQSLIFEINGVKIFSEQSKESQSSSGGQAYDQSLNTTDDVTFNSVKTDILTYTAIQFNLPEGNGTPPSEVEIGDSWVDTSDSTIKVRLI